MSDFVDGFWSIYIAGITLVSIVGCAVLLTMQHKKRPAEQAVETTGHLWDEDLADYYRLCDLFVMANREMPDGDTEGFGLVFLEANACGKPVIASDLDGIPEAFNVTGFGQLVERGSVRELAEAMKYWATQSPLRMAARLEMHQKVAEQFSLERAARELSKLYQSLEMAPNRTR